jgi:hypothetical protein
MGSGPKLTLEELDSLADQLDNYTANLSKLMASDARHEFFRQKGLIGSEKVLRAYLVEQLPRLVDLFRYLLDDQGHLFSRLRNIYALRELPYGEMKRAVGIVLNIAQQTDSREIAEQLEHWYQLLEIEKETADAPDDEDINYDDVPI